MNLELERSYPTPFANSTLLPLLLLSLAKQKNSPDSSIKIKKEYDYVIVGAGAAGSVMASRLSELPCVSVLVLEAGGRPPLLTDVPAISRSYYGTDIDWQFQTTPQKYTGRAMINRQLPWPAGKAIGGSSIINAMFYVRGNKKNYDDWEAMGAKGWSYNDVFPYFLKLEDNQDPKFLANGFHVTGGPVTVHQPRYHSELQRALYKAAIDLGYEVLDSNAERQTGFYIYQANLKNSQRWSTAKAYLVPSENRTNLDIVSNAMVKKVVISKRRAIGVRFDFNGHTYEIKAKREVILSAGTVNTAQLLMLSGVGPRRELEKLNIPVKADLPVGKNLQDHGDTQLIFELNPTMPDFLQRLTNPDNIKEYIQNRTGPLALPAACDMLAFLKGEAVRPAVDSPNYELYLGQITTPVIRDQFNLIPEVYRKYIGPYENKPLFLCTVSEVQPWSRGTVTLRSKNPYDSPVIEPNFLKDPRDVEDMVQGMKTCQKLAENKHLRKLGVRPLRTVMPGCENYVKNEDNYFRCYLRSLFGTIHHAVGTARMGDPRDPSTVVDAELKVKNINGLRVVDASVMPKIITGNTHIPTIMIAEKAADMIKETTHCYKKRTEHWNEPHRPTVWLEKQKDGWSDEKETSWVEEDHDEDYHDDSPNEEKWVEQEEDESWREKKKYKEVLERPRADTDGGMFSGEYAKHIEKSSWLENEDNTEDKYSDFPHISAKYEEELENPCIDKKEVICKEYVKHPAESSWSENEDNTEDIHIEFPHKSSRGSENEQDSKNFMKDQREIPFIKMQKSNADDYYKDSLTTSWYRKKPNDKPTPSFRENIEQADLELHGKLHGYKWDNSHMKSTNPWL